MAYSAISPPKWPEFHMELSLPLHFETNMDVWRGSTDTGRPRTPIFSVLVQVAKGAPERVAREMLRAEFDRRFKKAHPNGCPGKH